MGVPGLPWGGGPTAAWARPQTRLSRGLSWQENVSLADILSLRDSGLSEQEAWAVCLECSLSMRSVAHAAIFQTLCITPDTLAFNTSGNVCFMELLSGEPGAGRQGWAAEGSFGALCGHGRPGLAQSNRAQASLVPWWDLQPRGPLREKEAEGPRARFTWSPQGRAGGCQLRGIRSCWPTGSARAEGIVAGTGGHLTSASSVPVASPPRHCALGTVSPHLTVKSEVFPLNRCFLRDAGTEGGRERAIGPQEAGGDAPPSGLAGLSSPWALWACDQSLLSSVPR